jgi:hypothetical protein
MNKTQLNSSSRHSTHKLCKWLTKYMVHLIEIESPLLSEWRRRTLLNSSTPKKNASLPQMHKKVAKANQPPKNRQQKKTTTHLFPWTLTSNVSFKSSNNNNNDKRTNNYSCISSSISSATILTRFFSLAIAPGALTK